MFLQIGSLVLSISVASLASEAIMIPAENLALASAPYLYLRYLCSRYVYFICAASTRSGRSSRAKSDVKPIMNFIRET